MPHETNSLLHSIDLLKNKIKEETFIIGDEGFIINDNKYIKIVTPKRKNQKSKNTNKELSKLKIRYKIDLVNWKILIESW